MNTDEHGWRETTKWRRVLLPLLGERAGVRAGQRSNHVAKQSRGLRVNYLWALDVGRWTLDVQRSTSNAQRSTFNAQRSTSAPLSSFSPLTGLLHYDAADVRWLNDVDVRARHYKEPTVRGNG